jgi:hypothetical protein
MTTPVAAPDRSVLIHFGEPDSIIRQEVVTGFMERCPPADPVVSRAVKEWTQDDLAKPPFHGPTSALAYRHKPSYEWLARAPWHPAAFGWRSNRANPPLGWS